MNSPEKRVNPSFDIVPRKTLPVTGRDFRVHLDPVSQHILVVANGATANYSITEIEALGSGSVEHGLHRIETEYDKPTTEAKPGSWKPLMDELLETRKQNLD
jgi:hypothetical protein